MVRRSSIDLRNTGAVLLTVAVLVAVSCATVATTAHAEPGPPPGIPAPPPSRFVDEPAGDGGSDRTTAWERAVAQAEGPHLDQVLEPRPLAAIIGTAWFLLALRSRWRERRRRRTAS